MIVSDEKTRAVAIQAITRLDITKPQEVTIKPHRKSRTLAQNRLMHKWFACISEAHHNATGQAFKEEVWKTYLKDLFLGYDAMMMPNGTIKHKLKETSKLNVTELTEFLEKVQAWAVNELELHLPSGDDLYFEAMGIKRK
jgi:hypothetical protein